MKCTKCGAEFQGNFCPNCGSAADNAGRGQPGQAANGNGKPEGTAGRVLKLLCRFFCAAACLLFGAITLASLAGSAMSVLGEPLLTGYGWISDSTGGYAVAMLVFAILCLIAGGIHTAYIVLENRRRVTALAFDRVPVCTILAFAGAILLAGGTISAIAAAAYVNGAFFGMYSCGAAIICPLVFGLIFLLASAAAIVFGIFIKRYSYNSATAPANLRLPKDPSFWSGLPENFDTAQNRAELRALKSGYRLRIGVLSADIAVALFGIIMTVMAIADAGRLIGESPALGITLIFALMLIIFAVLPVAGLFKFLYRPVRSDTTLKQIKRGMGAYSVFIAYSVLTVIYYIFMLAAHGMPWYFEAAELTYLSVVLGIALFILNIAGRARLKRQYKKIKARAAGKDAANTVAGDEYDMFRKYDEMLYYKKSGGTYASGNDN